MGFPLTHRRFDLFRLPVPEGIALHARTISTKTSAPSATAPPKMRNVLNPKGNKSSPLNRRITRERATEQSPRQCCGRRFPRVGAYTIAAATRSTDCFAGASASRATSMITSTAMPLKRPNRSFGIWNAITVITAARSVSSRLTAVVCDDLENL